MTTITDDVKSGNFNTRFWVFISPVQRTGIFTSKSKRERNQINEKP
jgi:hypothetical protein